MAWCRQATSHYLSQCWPRSMSPYGVIRPQWVNTVISEYSGYSTRRVQFHWLEAVAKRDIYAPSVLQTGTQPIRPTTTHMLMGIGNRNCVYMTLNYCWISLIFQWYMLNYLVVAKITAYHEKWLNEQIACLCRINELKYTTYKRLWAAMAFVVASHTVIFFLLNRVPSFISCIWTDQVRFGWNGAYYDVYDNLDLFTKQ